MANLTIVVEDEVLKRARIRALEQGTSVNALLREYLSQYVGTRSSQVKAVENVLRIAKKAKAGSGGKRTWTRDELYERD
jgi:plasmid stability protein